MNDTSTKLQQAFEAGYKAFEDGKTLNDNPAPTGTPEYAEWQSGFDQAEIEYED